MSLSSVAAREVVHLLILDELSKVRHDAVTVKGGVNLRMFFRSVRYSEDIDLDGVAEASTAIRRCIAGVFEDRTLLRRLQRIGIRGLDPGEGPNKDTRTTYRHKFGVIVPGDIRYPTKVEVSFRDPHPADEVATDTPDEAFVGRYGPD